MSERIEAFEAGLDLLAELLGRRLRSLAGKPGADETGTDGGGGNDQDIERRCAELALVPGQSLDYAQSVLLLAAAAPHLAPNLFDRQFAEHLPEAGDFPDIGGARGRQFRGFLPTADTVLFLLDGGLDGRSGDTGLGERLRRHGLFSADNPLVRDRLVTIESPPSGEPATCGRLLVSDELIGELIHGRPALPRFGVNFPAARLTTARRWDELVVNRRTAQELSELRDWLQYREVLLRDWDMARIFPCGYRVLFHGPPGTGKTLTASLLARETGHEVYRIDLSMVVSKYIGETEKNLEGVFERAANKDWILFFDEADALFGKRTGVRDAHDRYANQEVSYLLQRVEQFPGLVILATNLKSNIDNAFLRRFQSVVHFPRPGPDERLRIWRGLVPRPIELAPDLDLAELCRRYELTGSHISNIMQYCLVRCAARGDNTLRREDVITAVEREFQKEGRSV